MAANLEKLLPPYGGAESYVYLCFSPEDRADAQELLIRLRQRGCRVWYSMGRSSNAAQEANYGQRMLGAGLCIALVTDAFTRDTYAKGNVLYLQAHGVPVILVKCRSSARALSLGLREDTPVVEATEGVNDAAEGDLIACEGFSHAFLGQPETVRLRSSSPVLPVLLLLLSAAFLVVAVLCVKGVLNPFGKPAPEPDPLTITELTLTALPADPAELEKYPNLEVLRIPQSEADSALELLDRYTILLYEEGTK